MIVRPLWATYIVTSEQNPSGIVISEPNKIRKWVVEKFYGISPGLVSMDSHGPQEPRFDIFEAL